MGDTLVRRLRATLEPDVGPVLWTRPFLLVSGTYLFSYSSYAAVNPTFAAYLGTITDSEALVGVAFGAFTFAAVLARPLTGWLLDRVDRRLVHAVAVVALAAATVAFTWVAFVWIAIALRVVHGLTWGLASTATPTIAADVLPAERRSQGLAYFGIVPNVALLALPAAGLWAAHRYGFHVQFVGAAALALLALVPLSALDVSRETAGSTETAGSSETAPTPGSLYDSSAVRYAFLVGLGSVSLGAIDVLLPLYAGTVGLANAGVFFTVMAAAIILARSLAGRLSASTPTILSGSFTCQAAGLLLVSFVPRLLVIRGLPLGLLAGAGLFGLGFALVFPVLQDAAVRTAAADRRGSATATVLVGMDLGIGLGAIGAGVLAEVTGFTAVYATAALLTLSGVGTTHVLLSRAERGIA